MAEMKKPRPSPRFLHGGGKGSRTHDLLNAIQTLYQLSYTPSIISLVHRSSRRRTLIGARGDS